MSSITSDLALQRRIRLPLLPLVVALYAAAAAAIAPGIYLSLLERYVYETVVLPPLLVIGLVVAGVFANPRAPLTFIVGVIRRNALRFVLIFGGFCAGIAAFTTFKLTIPALVPFYADAVFADIDHFLHFGDPGAFVHAVLPTWAQYPLAFLYGPVWFVLWFGLTAFVALHDKAGLRRRYFWTMAFAICGLGTVLATALSSVGPVFYEPVYGSDRFAALMASVFASPVGDYMRETSAYLYANYLEGGHALGTGISAMPSVHLAIVTLNALMLGSLNRTLGVLAWIYVALILVGSVFLGWHYAIDGYVSIAVVALIWWAVGRVLNRSIAERPAAAAA